MRSWSLYAASVAAAALMAGCATTTTGMTDGTMMTETTTTTQRPGTTMAAAQAMAGVPLISREALFGDPVRTGGQMSPDGKWLSWLAPHEGVRNVWIAPADNPSAARVMTNARDRPIPAFLWSGDSKTLIYIQDKGGDENYLAYGVDVASGKERTLTPFQNTRVRLMGASMKYRDEILVGLNNRDPRWHDVYRLNLSTGKLSEVMRGDGYAGFMADDDLAVRLAAKPNAAGGTDWFRVNGTTVEDKAFLSTDLEDAATGPAGFTTDGKTLYWTETRGRDTVALYAQDMASGTKRLIGEDPRADLGGTLTNPRTGEVEAYAVNYLRNEWMFVNPAIEADYRFLKERLGPGEVAITDRTEADDRWLVATDPVTRPGTVYVFDRKSRQLTPFYTARPQLADAPLVAMHPVEIRARDGLTLPSYLTLPKSADPDGDGRANRPVPTILFVHGGPWARDGYGYNAYHQWLANRGYAVLSVNFRSSTGFGKKFLNAGNRQWGLAMHDDLIDAKRWLVSNGVAPADKVGIMGGSYGGYATLAGLAFTPDEFACGVDIVGPSNLETLLATIPPYWEAGRRQMYARMGDPNTPEGLALLRAASPLYKADKITRPLLIGQGANDPRVKQAESDQIVSAMQARSIPVTYVLFPDEGHGFAKPANNIAFNAVAENFLAQCLGGRAEPIGTTVASSTAQIKVGADRIPGLSGGN